MVLMCSGCGATIDADDVTQGGHVIPGSIPDLCGPVDEANPAVCRHCSATYYVPKLLVPKEHRPTSAYVEIIVVPESHDDEISLMDLSRWPLVHRCAAGSPIESSHAG